MFIYIFIAVLITVWVILVRDLNKIPETKDEDYDMDDPTTTFWHDDEHYPDSKL